MTSAKTITNLLTEAVSQNDPASLRKAFDTLLVLEKGILLDRSIAYDWPHDLYLFVCETALKFSEWDIAHHCQDKLLLKPTSTKAYQIRTLYCRAELDSHDSEGQRCQQLIDSAQAAIAKVSQGIRLALVDPARHSHLVVLGTQHLWNVAKVLYKEGTFNELVNPFSLVIQALEKIDHTDWNVRNLWLLRQCTTLIGSGRGAEANTILQKAAETVGKYSPSFKIPVYRMQVALSKAVANPKVRTDGAKGLMRGVFAAQALFCGLLEGAAAEAEILAAYAEVSAEIKAAEEVAAAKQPQPASPKAPPPAPGGKGKGAGAPAGKVEDAGISEEAALRDETLGELALALALIGQLEKAHEATNKALQSKRLRCRVFAEYAQAMLMAHECGGLAVQQERHAGFLTPAMINELGNAVRKAERALESAIRIVDLSDRSHVVQIGAVIMWNIALPLLQNSTRTQIAKPFQTATKFLEEVGSNMNLLRVLLNHECALCDLDNDYLNKATNRLQKSLSIDYNVDADTMKLYGLERPLDRFLVWTKKRVDIKANMYEHPDNAEDSALLILEQARDAPLLSKLSTLSRALSILRDSEPPADFLVETPEPTAENAGGKADNKAKPKASKAVAKDVPDEPVAVLDPETEKLRVRLRNRAMLWHSLMTSAWKERSPTQIETTRAAATYLLKRTWVRRGDRDMRILQAEALITQADTALVELESKGLNLWTKKFFPEQEATVDEEDELDDLEAAEGEALPDENEMQLQLQQQRLVQEKVDLLQKAHTAIADGLQRAGQIGVELVNQGWDDQWLVINAATVLWNYYCKTFSENNFITSLAPVEALFNMLLSVQINPKKETQLLRDFGSVYVRGLIQLYMRERLNLEATFEATQQIADMDFYSFSHIDNSSSARLNRAIEVCEKLIQILPTPMDTYPFVTTAANVRRLQGKLPDPRSNPQHKVMTILDQAQHPTISGDDKRALLHSHFEFLAADPNIELCARFAEKCVNVSGCERLCIKVCNVGQQLYDEGLLGLRQAEIAAPVTTKESGKPQGKGKPQQTEAEAAPQAKPNDPPPKPTPQDWLWYALLLQYQAIAVSQLVNPAVQDKSTQFEIRRQALVSLANSAAAALQGPVEFRGSTVMKAFRYYRGMCHEFALDATSREFAYPSLRVLMSEKILTVAAQVASKNARPNADQESDADVIAVLFLFLLRCYRDHQSIQEGLVLMKTAVKILPNSHHKPFWDLDIQLRCQAGLPTNQTLLRVKEYNVETQARVWLTLARSTKDLRDKLFAYQSAVDCVASNPTEQAAYILTMAQWLLETNANITVEALKTQVATAIDLLADFVDADVDDDAFSDQGSIAGKSRASMSHRKSSVAPSVMNQSNRMSISRGGSSVRGRRGNSRATVKQLALVIQAYYLLYKLGGHGASGGAPSHAERRTCLLMMVHYINRMWAGTVASANAAIIRNKAKQEKSDAKNAMLGSATVVQIQVGDPKAKTAAKGGKPPPAPVAGAPNANGANVTIAEKEKERLPTETVTVPITPQGWTGFVLPNGLGLTLRGMRNQFALTPGSFDFPDALLTTLDDLTSELNREGMASHTACVLTLMQLLVEVFFPNGSSVQTAAKNAILFKLSVGAEKSGDAYFASLFRIGNPHHPPSERTALAEDARMASEIAARKDSSKADDEEAEQGNGGMVQVLFEDKRYIHRFWLSTIESLVAQGKFTSAKELLADAEYHARSYADLHALGKVRYWKATISFLEGDYDTALNLLKSGEGNGMVNVYLWIESKLLESEILLESQDYERAFAVERSIQEALQLQLDQCPSGVQLELAKALIPELQCVASTRFVRLVLAVVRRRPDIRVPPPTILKGIVSVLNSTLERALAFPSQHTALLLLEVELSHFERENIKYQGPSAMHKQLQREAQTLSRIVASLKSQLAWYTGSADGIHGSATKGEVTMQLSHVLAALGENTLRRIHLTRQNLTEFRKTNVTSIAYPVVEGALEEHEKEVVRFMRSTKKERTAAERRRIREQLRAEVEAKRQAARQEKKEELEKRREARRLEELQQQQAGKGPKKPAPKAAVDTLDMEISPDDKCGIPSPPSSDDDGMGEDSVSEDEAEIQLSTKTICGVEEAVQPSLTEALELFQSAIDLGCPAVDSKASLGLCATLELMTEAAAISTEQRNAMFKGEAAPNQVGSRVMSNSWNLPVTVAVVEADADKKAPKKDEAKKPQGKGAVNVPVTQPNEAELKKKAKEQESLLMPKLRTKSNLLVEATQSLESTISDAYNVDDFSTLSASLVHYANVSVGKRRFAHAHRAICAAQASKMADYILKVWESSCFSDLQELVLYRSLRRMRENNPAVQQTPNYYSLLRSLQQTSKMFHRLRLPSTITHFEATEPNVGTAVHNKALEEVMLPSNDIAVLTLLVDDGELYCALYRPGGVVDLRRGPLNDSALEEVAQMLSKCHSRRANILSQSNPSVSQLSAIDEEFSTAIDTLQGLLAPQLSAFTPVFDTLAAKGQLVLCLDPTLVQFPFEALPIFSKFKNLSRELSHFAAREKFNRRSAEKFSATQTAFVLDVHFEAPASGSISSACKSIFAPDEKPRVAGWSIVSPVLDENGNLRPLSVAAIQKTLAAQTLNSTALVTYGSLANAIPLPHICGLNLEHLRLMCCLDRACNSDSIRRENKINMAKATQTLWAEQSWNVALLLLARGVENLIINCGPASSAANDMIGRTMAQVMEKGSGGKQYPEILRHLLISTEAVPNMAAPATLASEAPTTGKVAGKRETLHVPDAPVAKLQLMDKFNCIYFGVGLDDSAAGKAK